MTASIENTLSAIKVLEDALDEYDKMTGAPWWLTYTFNVRVLLNSIRKCFESLSAQIRFYQSAKGTGRTLIVTNKDGSTRMKADGTPEVIQGQQVQTLRLALPGNAEDAIIYGKPESLQAIANALRGTGQTVTGPAPIHDHARQLANAATERHREKAEVT